jgi:hypothetical protein
MVKFAARIGLGKLPSYRFAGPMAGVVPGSDLRCQGLDVAHAPVKALCGKSRSCSLSPSEPTALDGGSVPLKRVGELESRLRWQSRGKGSEGRCIHVVWSKAKTTDQGLRFFDQLLHQQRLVDGGASGAHLHQTPGSPGGDRQSNTARATTLIVVIWTFRAPRLHGHRRESLTHALTRPRLKAHDRGQRVLCLFVTREHVFQVPSRVPGDVASAPGLDEPRLTCIFLRMCLTVSRDRAAVALHAIS